MFNRILIATDGSDQSERALAQGLELAKTFNVGVVLLTATEMWSALDVSGPDGLVRIEKFEAARKQAAEAILEHAAEKAKGAGIACERLHVPDRAPAVAIVETAEARQCDLIVMGTHGRRGLDRMLVGSQAQKVAATAKVPVLICR